MVETILAWDVALFRWVNRDWSAPWLDFVMIALSHRLVWLVVIVLGLGVVVARRQWAALRLALVMGVAVFLADTLAYEGIKPRVGRLRPCHQWTDVVLPDHRCGGLDSFPSNHAANGAAIAGSALAAGFPAAGAGLFGVAFLVGISRAYLGAHFPLDIFAGWILGAVMGFGCGRLGRGFVREGRVLWRPKKS